MTFDYFLAYVLPFLSAAIGGVAGVTLTYAKLKYGIEQVHQEIIYHSELQKKDGEIYSSHQLTRDKELIGIMERILKIETKTDSHLPIASCENFRLRCQQEIQDSLSKIETCVREHQRTVTDKFENISKFMGAVEHFMQETSNRTQRLVPGTI